MPFLTFGDAASITSLYPIEGTLTDVSPVGDGHINDTWAISFHIDGQVDHRRYCLQRINHHVFSDVEGLMGNIEKVTRHIRKAIISRGGDPERETLNLLQAKDGCNWVKSEDYYYRIYLFIENSSVISTSADYETTSQAGKAFGSFLRDLASYRGEPLVDTIPDFHNTPFRYRTFTEALERDRFERAHLVENEIAFVRERAFLVDIITEGLESGDIPVRISHNDTKINNVLFERDSGEALCVIDLDTVMPGSVLYDFGDAVRLAASTSGEDERNLSKVNFSIELFEALAEGFLSAGKGYLVDREIELLPMAAVIMTLEIGMRFLTDFLEGDTYFKVEKKNHNLDRCRTQFKMVDELEKAMDSMTMVVKKVMSRALQEDSK